MKNFLVLISVLVLCRLSNATMITYSLTTLGGGNFENVYTIENDTLTTAIEQFTFWFDASLYADLAITTKTPFSNNWNEIILPSSGFDIPIGYDALALTGGIGIGETVTGFAVSFKWLGSGLPGGQVFEIIDPANHQPIESGNTIPEPTTFLLFTLTAGLLKKRTAYQ
ncbi:MAG: hypothetical protein ABFD79_17020 [Phycisphaerales bacterium]